MFILKTQGRDRGWVEARPLEARREAAEEARAILADLREYRCTAAEAAIRFDQASMPIPDSLRLLLAKETLEAPLQRKACMPSYPPKKWPPDVSSVLRKNG